MKVDNLIKTCLNNKKSMRNIMVAAVVIGSGLGGVTVVNHASVVSADKLTHVRAKATVARSAEIIKKSFIYNKKGKRLNIVPLNKGTYVTTYGSKTIKGKKYYSIGKGQYVRAKNLIRPLIQGWSGS